jgi:hypothetical protein
MRSPPLSLGTMHGIDKIITWIAKMIHKHIVISKYIIKDTNLSTHEYKVQGVREIKRKMKTQMDTSHIRTK